MDTSRMKITGRVPTNLAGVRSVQLAGVEPAVDHATNILSTLALTPGAVSEALRSRIRAQTLAPEARIIPHLVPQLGVTHVLTSRHEIADTAYTSNNWAGSTIPGTWNAAVGIWRVPSVSIPETPAGTNGGWDSSSWVGIDGTYGSNDVLQAGIQQSVAGDGSTTYVAWYEWFAPKVKGSPDYIYQTNIDNIDIQPGDEVFAGIYYRNGKGLVIFGNVDRGQYFQIEVDAPPGASMSGNSIEWIMEAPNTGEPGTSLPGFTPVEFSAAFGSSTVGGAGDPAKGDSTNITLNGQNLTSVALATDAVTITRVAPPWRGFELSAGGAASLTGGIAAVSRVPGSMEVWYVAPNGSVQDRFWYDNAAWQGFELAGGGSASPTGGIAAVSRIPESMELWYVGTDGSMQDRFWYDGAAWQGFELAPAGSADAASAIAAVSRIPGSMELWWIAPNGSVQGAFWYDGNPWGRYELSPAGSASPSGGIAAVSRVPGSMEVWYVAPNGSVQDRFWYEGSTWQGFELAPAGSASPSGGVAAVSRIPNSMEVWFVGSDGSLQDRFWYDGGSWQGFALSPGGSASLSGGIAAVSRIPNSMELWFVGADGSLQDRFWYDGGAWQGFPLAPAGSAPLAGSIAAVSRIPASMELWHSSPSGSVEDHFWYGAP